MKKLFRLYIIAAVIFILGLYSCTELKTDLPTPVSSGFTVHKAEWMDTSQVNFHGKFLKAKSWTLNDCQPCHSKTFDGGTSEVSCFSCHSSYPHPSGWGVGIPTDWPFASHNLFLQSDYLKLYECKSCHGEQYAGEKRVEVSCMTAGCHVDKVGKDKSPEACNTCHGDFRAFAKDTVSWAPPRSLAGDSTRTMGGVGAHRQHLVSDSLGKAVKCQECHLVPDNVFTLDHIGLRNPRKHSSDENVKLSVADVIFQDSLAALISGDGTLVPNPSYNSLNNKCSNTFCHGNWKLRKESAPANLRFAYTDSVMVGLNSLPLWTGTSSEVACGTCHGLPPQGHLGASVVACVSCHGDVTDNTGKIVNKSKHINGKIDLTSGFGGQRNFR